MKIYWTHLLLAGSLIIAAPGCKKDDPKEEEEEQTNTDGEDPINAPPTTVVVRFSNMTNGHDVDQDSPTGTMYSTGNGYNVGFNTVKYYIINVVLIRDDGGQHYVPDYYHLIDEDDIKKTGYLLLENTPGGNYVGMRFTVGVDSAKVASGDQSGDLDPVKGMFWSASQGYKAFVVEGTSTDQGAATYSFHVGGFDALKTFNIGFDGHVVSVDGTGRPLRPHIYADMLEIFKNPTPIDLTSLNTINGPGANSLIIANNYADVFTFAHIDTH